MKNKKESYFKKKCKRDLKTANREFRKFLETLMMHSDGSIPIWKIKIMNKWLNKASKHIKHDQTIVWE